MLKINALIIYEIFMPQNYESLRNYLTNKNYINKDPA